MFTRSRILLGMVLLLSLFLAPTVFAGGWAVITLDDLPINATAGEPLAIGFMVRQHGRTPTPGLSPTITFTLPKEEQFTVSAKEDEKTGHYSATVTFPTEGEWNWTIDAFTFPQLMPVISVVAAAEITPGQPAAKEAIPYMLIVRVVALGLGLLGLYFTLRTKSRTAIAVTALCLMLGFASFIPGTTAPKVEAQTDTSSQLASEVSISQVEYGRRLFIAKGCVTCHVNDKAFAKDSIHIEMGAPNLTNFSASSEALQLRLKDPTLVKSDTNMPNLNLSETEIEALIAFINSK